MGVFVCVCVCVCVCLCVCMCVGVLHVLLYCGPRRNPPALHHEVCIYLMCEFVRGCVWVWVWVFVCLCVCLCVCVCCTTNCTVAPAGTRPPCIIRCAYFFSVRNSVRVFACVCVYMCMCVWLYVCVCVRARVCSTSNCRVAPAWTARPTQ